MPLQKQVQILSLDTGNFYSNSEIRLHKLNHKLKYERRVLKDKIEDIKKLLYAAELSDSQIEEYCSEAVLPEHCCDTVAYALYKYCNYKKIYFEKTQKIKKSKVKLQEKLKRKTEQNINSGGKNYKRTMRIDTGVSKAKEISVFDSAFTRTIGAKINEFTDSFMVVQVYYFDILKDLLFNGYYYNNEKYIYFTSSAGQIRVKKAVFVKEAIWKQYEKTFMCGLSIDEINANGGCNINKFLAYLALNNSASDVWEKFDIDKTIVIDDFETNVLGTYDFVDDKDYSITRKTDYVPIPHTDGCGMILPNAFGEVQKNRMIRMPFVKGLLGVFPFDEFIKERNCSSVIKDIYGVEHDIIAEGIQVILTKSQTKMWKYYSSWEDYKDNFKKYNCTANYANIEEDRIKNAKINYQMLQTLTDMTDKELLEIAKPSINKLNNICKSVQNIKNIFNITPYNINKTPLQECIDLYPNLINDQFLKDKIREVKDSLIKKYKSGKLEVQGKYTFILPDLYAACEYWFCHNENPDGILADGEVFCSLFSKNDELDCLRSPHLFCEHSINKNIACKKYADRQIGLRRWFCTNALYTSTHSLISKILMFDVDGDRSLVLSDVKIINVAKRNLKKYNIVPLYYNMRKAEPTIIESESIYNGLCAAFTGSNIGQISNNITKIWNSDFLINGDIKDKEYAINMIKIQAMMNNEIIDFAKTLYRSTPPKHIARDMKEFTKLKVPYFFKYAKDKSDAQIAEKNESIVNKIDDIIKNPRLNLARLHIKKPDYKLLMSNPDIEIQIKIDEKGNIVKEETNPIITKYLELNSKYRLNTNYLLSDLKGKDIFNDAKCTQELICQKTKNEVKSRLSQYGFNDNEICDMLIKYLYGIKNSKRKNLLWICYGDIILENLKRVLSSKTKEIRCIECGEWLYVNINNTKTCRCDNCQKEFVKWYDRQRKRRIKNSV